MAYFIQEIPCNSKATGLRLFLIYCKTSCCPNAHKQVSKQAETGNNQLPNKLLTYRNMHTLPANSMLGNNDVLCGRTRNCNNHVGNKRFRKMVQDSLQEYAGASNRADKTSIINAIINKVRQNSGNGGFVKKEPMSGLYFDLTDAEAVRTSVQICGDPIIFLKTH
jgi:hypothetical protein